MNRIIQDLFSAASVALGSGGTKDGAVGCRAKKGTLACDSRQKKKVDEPGQVYGSAVTTAWCNRVASTVSPLESVSDSPSAVPCGPAACELVRIIQDNICHNPLSASDVPACPFPPMTCQLSVLRNVQEPDTPGQEDVQVRCHVSCGRVGAVQSSHHRSRRCFVLADWSSWSAVGVLVVVRLCFVPRTLDRASIMSDFFSSSVRRPRVHGVA